MLDRSGRLFQSAARALAAAATASCWSPPPPGAACTGTHSSATTPSRWPKQQWEMHRSKIYLGTSVLIFLLVLTLPQRSPETNLTMFKEISLGLGLAGTPSMPVPDDDHPDAGVWVDLHTGLYYCSGTEAYGKTGEGKFTNQRQAREEHFKPAASNGCQ